MLAKPRPLDRVESAEAAVAARAADLDALYGHLDSLGFRERYGRELFPGDIPA